MDYIYIDESGDLGKDSNFLIMGAVIVNDKIKLDRIIKKVRKNNKKELGNSPEIKGTKTPKHIKKKILKNIKNIDYYAIIIVFNKINKYKINYNNDNNLLYNIIATELSKQLKIKDKTFIIIDKSKNKENYLNDFNKMFIPHLNNSTNYPVIIKHENSINHKGLQIADLISWSTYQYIEHKNDEYINLIKNKKIIEIFGD